MKAYKNLLTQQKRQCQQLPITMFLTSTPSAETEVKDNNDNEDTAPTNEVPAEVVPSEEL